MIPRRKLTVGAIQGRLGRFGLIEPPRWGPAEAGDSPRQANEAGFTPPEVDTVANAEAGPPVRFGHGYGSRYPGAGRSRYRRG